MLMKVVGKVATSRVGCLAIGAGAMYLADPDRGRSRRAELRSRAEGVARGQVRRAGRRTEAGQRDLMHRLEGAMARARGGGTFHPESEVDLREHLRQVVHTVARPGHQVNVDVAAGRAKLRGQVQDEAERARIVRAVGQVQGVAEVEDLTHLPGQPAPNKKPLIGS
jgi:osmotically-inducible protein OsmY